MTLISPTLLDIFLMNSLGLVTAPTLPLPGGCNELAEIIYPVDCLQFFPHARYKISMLIVRPCSSFESISQFEASRMLLRALVIGPGADAAEFHGPNSIAFGRW